MNPVPLSDDDLLLQACGELEAARRDEFEAALGEAPERQAALQRLREALEALRPPAPPSLGDDFNRRLRDRLLSEELATGAASRRGRSGLRRWMPAAAALLAGIAIGWTVSRSGFAPASDPIAWAEVQAAMASIPHFHATVLGEKGSQSIWMDYYYRRPGRWRAHGLDQVRFYRAGQARTFDIRTKEFVDASEVRGPPLPPETLEAALEGNDFVRGILSAFFGEKAPEKEPVREALEASGGDMEVFDFADDPARFWMRIWVLKSSRLPVRMELRDPDDSEVMLVVFDYSDPQPEEFFDPDRFAEEVRSRSFSDPRRIYRVGQAPAGGKPRGPEQIFDLQGYRMPEFVEARAAGGDLLIIARDPGNRSPRGSVVEGAYHDELRDNRGNVYLRYYTNADTEGVLYQYYTPVPPERPGEGRHRLTLRYVVLDRDPNGMSYDRVIGEREIEVPAPSGSAIPGSWPEAESASKPLWKHQAMRQYYGRAGDGFELEQLAAIDAQLEEHPESTYLLGWKRGVLERLGDESGADDLLERLRDRALARPFRAGWEADRALVDHIRRLYAAGRMEEFRSVVRSVEEARDKILETEYKGIPRERADRTLFQNNLGLVPALPAGLESLEKRPEPRVEKAARSADGRLYLLLRIPRVDGVIRDGSRFWRSSGFSVPLSEDSTWKSRRSFSEDDLLFLDLVGDGDRLRLVFDPVVAASDSMTDELRLLWRLDVAVPEPTAATVEELDRQFGDRPGRREPGPAADPASEPAATALEHFESERYEEALESYRRLAARPAAEWPRLHEQPALDAFLREQERLNHRIQAARCLMALGRHAEAGELVEELLRWIEETGEFGAAKAAKRRLVWNVRWELIEGLIRRGLLDEARAILEPLESQRPDLRALDSLRRTVELPYGRTTTTDRQSAAAAWSRHDALIWKLERAERARRGGRGG